MLRGRGTVPKKREAKRVWHPVRCIPATMPPNARAKVPPKPLPKESFPANAVDAGGAAVVRALKEKRGRRLRLRPRLRVPTGMTPPVPSPICRTTTKRLMKRKPLKQLKRLRSVQKAVPHGPREAPDTGVNEKTSREPPPPLIEVHPTSMMTTMTNRRK